MESSAAKLEPPAKVIEEEEYEEVKAVSVDSDPLNELKPMAHYADQEEYDEIFKHLNDENTVSAGAIKDEEVSINPNHLLII
jgi:hypothetical protein